jgi:hypothetical protein
MTRLWALARAYGVDLLIVIAAVEGALEVALRDDPQGPHTTHWFAVPAIALVVLALLGLRDRVQAVVLAYQSGLLETDAL